MILRRKRNREIISPEQNLNQFNNNVPQLNNNNDQDFLKREDVPSLVKSNKDLNQWEVDVQKEVEEYIFGLQGYEYSAIDSVYKPQSPPTVNLQGAKRIQTLLRAVVNKHAINTALSEDDVHEICQIQASQLCKLLKYNKNIWEIKQSDLSYILWSFDRFMYIVLTRSINDRQREHTTQRTRLTGQVGSTSPNFPG